MMCTKRFIISCWVMILIISTNNCFSQSISKEESLMNIKGYPTVFELNIGEEYNYTRSISDSVVNHTIKLVKVTPYMSPNFWNLDEEGNGVDKFYNSAKVEVEIDRKLIQLTHR